MLSIIPTLSSATLQPLQNCQTLQWFLSPLYLSADADIHAFYSACREAGLKPIHHPFWESFPFADIFLSITPDILHQMLQGMVKHVVVWLGCIFGPAAINARCRAIPPNHKITLFTKGIVKLSRLSGQEHKRISCILLGLILDLPAPNGQDQSRIVRTVRALMDFCFIAPALWHDGQLQHRTVRAPSH